MSQGRCVGCGTPLSQGKIKEVKGKMNVVCRCGRIFIRDSKTNKYRRALFDEI